LIRFAISNAGKILPVSDTLKTNLEKISRKSSFSVLPNVVDTALFNKVLNKEQRQIKTILHVSNLVDKQKNISGILDAIADLSKFRCDFQLKIIAESNYEYTLSKIKNLKIKNECISIEKSKTEEEISEIFKQADFLLLFSNYETFSVVMAEAWCSGIPAVYSKCGGLTDIDDARLGIQIEPNKKQDLKDAINNMLDSLKNYDSTWISAFASERFSKSLIGEKLKQEYKIFTETSEKD
jgi:glycosyltransferase involved in cell wall biosynthesis